MEAQPSFLEQICCEWRNVCVCDVNVIVGDCCCWGKGQIRHVPTTEHIITPQTQHTSSPPLHITVVVTILRVSELNVTPTLFQQQRPRPRRPLIVLEHRNSLYEDGERWRTLIHNHIQRSLQGRRTGESLSL